LKKNKDEKLEKTFHLQTYFKKKQTNAL